MVGKMGLNLWDDFRNGKVKGIVIEVFKHEMQK
jgi:hypothetical protein